MASLSGPTESDKTPHLRYEVTEKDTKDPTSVLSALPKALDEDIKPLDPSRIKEINEELKILNLKISHTTVSAAWDFQLEKGKLLLLRRGPGDLDEALKAFNQSEKYHPSVEVSFLKAEVFRLKQSWSEAFFHFEKGLEALTHLSQVEASKIALPKGLQQIFRPIMDLCRKNSQFFEFWKSCEWSDKEELLQICYKQYGSTELENYLLSASERMPELRKVFRHRLQGIETAIAQFYFKAYAKGELNQAKRVITDLTVFIVSLKNLGLEQKQKLMQESFYTISEGEHINWSVKNAIENFQRIKTFCSALNTKQIHIFGGILTDLKTAMRFYSKFPDLYDQFSNEINFIGMSPEQREAVRISLETLTEATAKAFLNLNKKFPDEAALFCNRKDITAEQFQKLSLFFMWVDTQGSKGKEFLKNAYSIFILPSPLFQRALFQIAALDPKLLANVCSVELTETTNPERIPVEYALEYAFGDNIASLFTVSYDVMKKFIKCPVEWIEIFGKWRHEVTDICAEKLVTLLLNIIQNTDDKENPSEKIIKILRNSGELLSHYPELFSRLIVVIQEDHELLDSLFALSKQMDKSAFAHAIKQYVAVEKSEGKYISNDIAKFFKNVALKPSLVNKFKEIIALEQANGVRLLPLYFANPLRLEDDIFKHFKNHLNLLSQFHPATWEANENYDALRRRLQENPMRFLNFLTIAGEYDTAIRRLVSDTLWKQDSLGDEILKLQADSFLRPFVKPLVKLISLGELTLAKQILSLSDIDLKKRLLAVVDSGEIALVNTLLSESEKDEKDHKASSEQTDKNVRLKILAELTVETVSISRALIRLPATHPILTIAAKESLKNPSRELKALLKLHAQGEEVLFKNFFENTANLPPSERANFLNFISKERFALAKDYLVHNQDPFWKKIIEIKNLDTIQQLRNLHNSLLTVNLTVDEIQKLDHFAFVMSKDHPDVFNNWIAFVQLHCRKGKEWVLRDLLNKPNTSEIVKEIKALPKALSEQMETIISVKPMQAIYTQLADWLILSGGGTNRSLIDLILSSDLLKVTKNEEQHVRRVLENLRNYSFFGDRLETIQIPKQAQEVLLVNTVLIRHASTPISTRDAQVAALSALLKPLRQSHLVGSCFGTATAIQMESTVTGLRYVLEDYISIISNGYLARIDSKSVRREFPISFDLEAYKLHFEKDHFLVRVREFSISSMSRSHTHVVNIFKDQLQENLKEFINANFSNESDRKYIQSLNLSDRIEENLSGRYFGYLKSVEKNRVGGWVLVKKDGLDVPLLSSKEQFQNFIIESISSKIGKSNIPKDRDKLMKVFNEMFVKYINSDTFLSKFFKRDLGEIHFGMNQEAFYSSPLIHFDGGSVRDVIEQYHQTQHVLRQRMPNSINSLSNVFQFVNNLRGRTTAISPEQLVLMTTPTHGMNLKVGRLIQQFEADSKMDLSFSTKWMDTNKKLMDTSLSEKEFPEFLNSYLKCFKSINPQLEEALRNACKEKMPKTFGEFCHMIIVTTERVTGDRDIVTKAKLALEMTIQKNDFLKNKYPNSYSVVDTNWVKDQRIDFGISFDGLAAEPYFANSIGVRAVSIEEPWPISTWEVYQYSSALDEYH